MKKPIHPLWGIVEIAAFAGIYFSVVYFWGLQIAAFPGLIMAVWVLIIAKAIYLLWISPLVLHMDKPEIRGWQLFRKGPDNPGSLKNAWPVYMVVTCIGAVVLTGYALYVHQGVFPHLDTKAMAVKLSVYLSWAVIQGIVFFGFILVRLRGVVGVFTGGENTLSHCGAVVVLTAIIFAAFHFPNPELTVFAFLAGIIWAWIFYHRPNIVLMGLSHAFLGTMLHHVVQLYMRIGPFYQNPEANIVTHIVPGLSRLMDYIF